MPLTNPPLLSNQELIDLFIKESNRFMEGLKADVSYDKLEEIHANKIRNTIKSY